jgi:hypothetical protein
MLISSGVGNFVDLQHAPLSDFHWEDQEYLFYDCLESLDRAARMLQRARSKVLVLVDGPPGNTGPNARYPALPVVLKYFAKHELHFVLDDYARSEEREIVRMWEFELRRRALEYQVKELSVEKGACLLKIS